MGWIYLSMYVYIIYLKGKGTVEGHRTMHVYGHSRTVYKEIGLSTCHSMSESRLLAQ